jgi:flagellar basal body-associated protein FliL
VSDSAENPPKTEVPAENDTVQNQAVQKQEAEVLVVDETLPAADGTSGALSDAELEHLAAYQPKIPNPPLKELLRSSDPPSRFVALLSIAFGALAAVCVTMLVLKYLEYRRLHAPPPPPPPKVAEKIITEPLGEFRMVLKPVDSPNDGELRVDIVAECSNVEACLYLKDHQIQARDVVIPVLMNSKRAELLNPDTKVVLRRRITEQLNSLPLGGKVIQVLFTDLTVEEVTGSKP